MPPLRAVGAGHYSGFTMTGHMTEAAVTFWRSYTAGLPNDHPPRPAHLSAFALVDPPSLATELAALVVSGRKTATASLPIQAIAEGHPVPKPGDVSIVTLFDGTPVAIIETRDVRLVEWSSVDADFAAAEGEGDRSLAWWRAAHRAYFGRVLGRLGAPPLDDTSLVVCERFRLVHRGDGPPLEASEGRGA